MTAKERLKKQFEVAEFKSKIHSDAMLAFQGITLGSCNCKKDDVQCAEKVENKIDVFCPTHWKLLNNNLRQELIISRNAFLKNRKNGWPQYAMHIVGAKIWLSKQGA